MKNHKILVDRKPLSETYIQSRQDFGNVLKGVKQLKPPLWKTAWFYGPVGMATVALTISASSIHANGIPIEQKAETNQLTIVEKEQPIEVLNVSEVPIPKAEEDLMKTELKATEVEITETIAVEDETENDIIYPKDQIIEEKTTLKKAFPNIHNIYTGDITFSELFSEDGITCGTKTITSFSIQYFNGKEDVKEQVEGNQIPGEISKMIERFNNGVMIYITEIKAIDENKKLLSLPSLNYIPRY